VRNLRATVESRGPVQITSVLLLLFTANGIFEPLEVALNRCWSITKNRSFLSNQLISLGLIFACGGLVLASTTLTAMNLQYIGTENRFEAVMTLTFFRLVAILISVLVLFLIYWLLPNTKVPPRQVLPIAFIVGIALELLKYVNLLTWPWLRAKLQQEYGPFVYSVTLILWGFLASMIILAGAEWAARRRARLGETTEKLTVRTQLI
jgi:membrane protein